MVICRPPGGPDEDPTGGFTQGGWSVGYWDGMMGKVVAQYLSGPFDLLLGRKPYEIFAAAWPFRGDDRTAKQLNQATKYVAPRVCLV